MTQPCIIFTTRSASASGTSTRVLASQISILPIWRPGRPVRSAIAPTIWLGAIWCRLPMLRLRRRKGPAGRFPAAVRGGGKQGRPPPGPVVPNAGAGARPQSVLPYIRGRDSSVRQMTVGGGFLLHQSLQGSQHGFLLLSADIPGGRNWLQRDLRPGRAGDGTQPGHLTPSAAQRHGPGLLFPPGRCVRCR